jgi:hypothetical protein
VTRGQDLLEPAAGVPEPLEMVHNDNECIAQLPWRVVSGPWLRTAFQRWNLKNSF